MVIKARLFLKELKGQVCQLAAQMWQGNAELAVGESGLAL